MASRSHFCRAAALLLAALAAPAAARPSKPSKDDAPVAAPMSEQFKSYSSKFAKSYESDAEAKAAERNFAANDAVIVAHNNQPLSFKLGHNKYSDMSALEFREAMLVPDLQARKLFMDKTRSTKVSVHKKGDYGLKEMLPQTVDWEAEGGVTPVSDQGRCAGSYAFSAVSAMESAAFIASGMKKGGLPELSRQQLLDCDYGKDSNQDQGCKGGIPAHAFGWTAMHGGLCLEEDYALISSDGRRYTCRQLSCAPQVGITGYKDVAAHDEDALQDAVAQQPVTVAVSASMAVFQLYKEGVFDHPLGKDLPPDHTMLVVGYGTTAAGVNYWKVKNSWGTTWGMDGYMLIKRGTNANGIAAMPSYPIGVGKPAEMPAPTEDAGPAMRGGPVPQPSVYEGACHPPKDGDVKLSSYPSGHVLLWYDNEWHTVCNEAANQAFATLVCKMLGFSRDEYAGDLTAPKSYPMISSPHCTGTEASLMDCRFDAVYKNDYCSTYRNMLAMYVTCADGEMTNYTTHCGYKAPDVEESLRAEALPQGQGQGAGPGAPRAAQLLLLAAVGAGVVAALSVGARAIAKRQQPAPAQV
mmetsp:Transcript_5622/g.19077  ORF Transcript_5622/g.19077 Transcript_5622/m.19077 type:complete len:580 (-) Transcript_5622:18-1757(-)